MIYELLADDINIGDIDSSCLTENMKKLISQCIDNDPQKRPNFKKIYKILTHETELFSDEIDEEEVLNYITDLEDDDQKSKNKN